MNKVCLQFGDVFHLLEFVEFTKTHECPIDSEKLTIVCELSEADLELAINGYHATVLCDQTP